MTSWDSPTAVSNLAAGVGSRDTGLDATPTLSRDTSVATHDSSGALDSSSTPIDNSQWGVITQHMKTTNISDDQSHSNGAQSQSPSPPSDSEPTVTVQDVWFTFQEADQARDLDDVKAALARLCEAYQDKSWVDLEEKLREKKCNTYLVATEDQISFGYTLVNLKGESNQEYRVIPSFIKPGTVKRGRMSIGMAASYEDNLARLDRAGVVRPSGVRKCHNCKQDGHVASECSEDKREPERSEYYGKCYNCGAEDHRTRTCPEPRKLIACRTCGKEGHMARDCTDPNITCNRCNQEGHIARDCDEPRTDVTCRRCNQMGHMLRDCPEPRIDFTCNRCNQPGHIARECPEPRDDIVCNRCSQPGHIARDCLEPRTDMVCRNCNEPGHWSRECDKPRQLSSIKCFNCDQFGHRASECTNEPVPGANDRRPPRSSRFGFSDGF